jgi:hypothetical protein
MITPLFKPDPVDLHAAALLCGVKPASQSKGVRIAETIREIRKAVADDLKLLFRNDHRYKALLYTMEALMPTFARQQVTLAAGPLCKCGCGCRCECPEFNPEKTLRQGWLDEINSGQTTIGYDAWRKDKLRPTR